MSELIPIKTFVQTCLADALVVQESHSEQFSRAGYIPIHADSAKWNEIHHWLGRNCSNQYTWTGNTFWFDDPRIAVNFALRFS